MRSITAALLDLRLEDRGLSLLDAGCGTGGFLAWATRNDAFDRLCGIDVSPEAIAFAREAVPRAELKVAPLHELPFDDAQFDLVVLNDVLQHLHEGKVEASLRELGRVLRAEGELLARTNAARRARRARSDWRLYDEQTLRRDLEQAGFRVQRTTHANMILSMAGLLRGRGPVPPTSRTCGIPQASRAGAGVLGRVVLGLEARFLRAGRWDLPWGHTLFALARPHSVAPPAAAPIDLV